MIQAKLIAGVAGLILTAGVGYYVVSLIGKNAVLEATLESTVTAMADYAYSTQMEIADWQESFDTISTTYQESRNERDQTINRVSFANINQMAKDDPDGLSVLSTRLINGLLIDLEAISQHSAADHYAGDANARPDGFAAPGSAGNN